jgi:hypothetical protein
MDKANDSLGELRVEVHHLQQRVSGLEQRVGGLQQRVSALETEHGAVIERAVREALKPRYGEVYLCPWQLSSLRNLMSLALTDLDDEKASTRRLDIMNTRAHALAAYLLSSGAPALLTSETHRPCQLISCCYHPKYDLGVFVVQLAFETCSRM